MFEKLKYFFKVFLPEVKGEWKKVTRPGRREVLQTTGVVILTSVIFAIYLWVADQLINWAYKGMFKILGL